MTPQEAKKMLKAKLECLKNETSGINYDCNMRLCDGCSLNYEQGNMGEQKEALDMAIKALEQQSITWIVGKDNCQVAVRNMPIDKMQKICAIIGEEEQQPKTGHWIWQTEDIYKCSECGEDIHVKEVMNKPQYVCCPMCEARMEVEE